MYMLNPALLTYAQIARRRKAITASAELAWHCAPCSTRPKYPQYKPCCSWQLIMLWPAEDTPWIVWCVQVTPRFRSTLTFTFLVVLDFTRSKVSTERE